MSGLIDSLIKMLKDSNAGFISTKVGKYTIIVTDDDDGAKVLNEAWDNYVEESEEKVMNRVILCGRVVRDPEIRYSQTVNGSMAVARYTLAVDRAFKKEGEQAADFINCIAFGKNGEFAEKYLHQGTKIIVEGRWQTGNYTNKDGQKVYTNDCVVEKYEFCESRANQQNNNNGIMGGNASSDNFMSIPDNVADEGLPFN